MTDSERDQLPRCATLAELRSCDGRHALVAGEYHAVALYQGKKARDVEKDHAKVKLTDGADVLLEPNWSPKSSRSAEERTGFDNRHVEVEGIVHLNSPEPPEQIAYIIGPCVSPVFEIRLVESSGKTSR